MLQLYTIGDQLSLNFNVSEADLAAFNGEMVHPFYSTFALGRDAEWTCRQFVLKMKEADEEGIGTFLNIRHKSPALLGETVQITATISRLEGNQIDCSFNVHIGERIIAEGEQGQRILKKSRIETLSAHL
jgi:predicted thioesterase